MAQPSIHPVNQPANWVQFVGSVHFMVIHRKFTESAKSTAEFANQNKSRMDNAVIAKNPCEFDLIGHDDDHS